MVKMSLQKRLQQIYEDMDARIEQFSSITAWVNELKRQYIAELGLVAQQIREIFVEEEYLQLSREDYTRLKNQVLGLLVEPSKEKTTK